MMHYWKPLLALVGACILGLFAAGILPTAAIAQKTDKTILRTDRTLILIRGGQRPATAHGRQQAKNFQEFMGFMEAEFDRLDKDKNGELDPKELTQSRIRAYRPTMRK